MLIFLKNNLKMSLIAFTATVLVSCHNRDHHTIEGSGNSIRQHREIQEEFKSIEVSSAVEVIIEQAEKAEIIVEAEDNLQKGIITEVRNGVLIIRRQNGSFTSHKFQKVYVKAPVIEEIIASSASTVKTKNTLKGENISLDCSSASKIEVKLAFDNIKAKSGSGSKIEMDGMALNLDLDANSASRIDADDLLANNIIAQASSGSSISIHPIVDLKANASSGANIEYNYSPKHIEKTTSSGGSVSH